MKYLAIDSAQAQMGIVLKNGERVYEKRESNDRRASEVLLSDIDELLDKAGLTLNDMDFFAVITGPGSFTGLRIGVNTVKSFAYVLDKKIVAVTSLEKLAYNSKKERVCVVIKAYADYCIMAEFDNDKKELSAPECLTYEEMNNILQSKKMEIIADEESKSRLKGTKKDEWKKSLIMAIESKFGKNELITYKELQPY
jgi:tRNA threonylcarbamoyl adenosine modification protein YeaZ